ncbi:hypothetical protein [Pontibacter pudoricolor]|uniref:hypothetical protein n=1 Tax=Pontibacter pudoricolor TaxID=2694930 RepID=UPI001390CA65|nr:hypothetical protein [Pontibacter pudoricolor]
MLKLKKRIDSYLKYPLMWVMLLWAFTLPGHEVRVYNFLLHTVAGNPEAAFEYASEEVSRSENQQTSHAYMEAAPAAAFAGKIKFQLLDLMSGELFFSPVKAFTLFPFSRSSSRAAALKDQLLIALLPNAP